MSLKHTDRSSEIFIVVRIARIKLHMFTNDQCTEMALVSHFGDSNRGGSVMDYVVVVAQAWDIYSLGLYKQGYPSL